MCKSRFFAPSHVRRNLFIIFWTRTYILYHNTQTTAQQRALCPVFGTSFFLFASFITLPMKNVLVRSHLPVTPVLNWPDYGGREQYFFFFFNAKIWSFPPFLETIFWILQIVLLSWPLKSLFESHVKIVGLKMNQLVQKMEILQKLWKPKKIIFFVQ